MKVTQQALAIARIQTGQGPVEEKARVIAWDRLNSMLSTLDSKTSVLLRFNAIVVAALAYVLVIAAPPSRSWGPMPTVKLMGHADRPWQPAGQRRELRLRLSGDQRRSGISSARGSIGRPTASPPSTMPRLHRMGDLVAYRTRLYSWAWRLAVAGGIGFAILVGIGTLH